MSTSLSPNDFISLNDCHAMINSKSSTLKKRTRDERETYQVTRTVENEEQFCFLKRYFSGEKRGPLKRLLSSRKFHQQALQEWRALKLFSKLKFPVPKPIALVKGESESFLLMEEVKSSCTIRDWFQRHSADQFYQERICKIEQIANMAQRMHRNHLHHQDFYLGHILLDEFSGDISLIDLGRAGRMKMFSNRWIVKDLAQLHYSSLGIWTDEEFLKFLNSYSGNSQNESLLASILAKSMKIALHSKKHNL